MSTSKVVLLTRRVDAASWDSFVAKKPADWQAELVNLNNEESEVIKQIEDAQYVVTTFTGHVSTEILGKVKQLKLIQTGGQDIDHLPIKWALDKDIPIANAGGANAITVAEYTILLMLACLRRLIIFNQSTRDGKFRSDIKRKGSNELYGKTIGIVGLGNIGRRVAKLCYGFGTDIIYSEKIIIPRALQADFRARAVSLDELLSISDIVTLHIPSLERNKGLIGWEQISKMKSSAYLINTARGAVVDQGALIRALEENKIAGAGLDVWEPEPPKPDNPLLKMQNVVALPHVAGLGSENVRPSYENAWRNILLVSEGKEPLNRKFEY